MSYRDYVMVTAESLCHAIWHYVPADADRASGVALNEEPNDVADAICSVHTPVSPTS